VRAIIKVRKIIMNSVTLSRSFFTNVQLAAFAVVLSFIFISVAMPAPARAAGLTDDQVKAVVSLLESFNADQTTLMRVNKALRGEGSLHASSTVLKQRPEMGVRPLCELLKRELRRGSQGDDVRELQKILAQDKEIYAEGEVTGFFGERTEAAVKRLQAKLGIVSSGEPISTGYGLVGAKTRAALIARCADNRGKGNMNTFRPAPVEGRFGTSSNLRNVDQNDNDNDNDDEGENDDSDDDSVSYKPSSASGLLASAATSMAAPFNLVTNLLSNTFLALGLY
jgi:murein L,D-transpeptidase YcbB/YkuD